MRLVSMFRRSRRRAAQMVVAVGAAERSGASWVTGDLVLPVSAIWGEFSVPAGEYAFIVPSWSPLGVVYVQSPARDALVVALAVEERPGQRTNALTLVRSGAHYYVRSLELTDPAVVLHFEVPEAAPGEAEVRWRPGAPAAVRESPADAWGAPPSLT